MKTKLCLVLLLVTGLVAAQKNDSLGTGSKKSSNEIGISVSSALFVLSGVSSHNERFTNLTVRHLFPKHHALKVFTGLAPFSGSGDDFQQAYLPPVGNTTIYPTSEKRTPSNFQVGIGYEYIIGKKKLKQAFGLDLVYNNKFERTNFYYMKVEDPSGSGSDADKKYTRIDTGAYVKGVNFDKYGFNLSYNLRYEASKHWVFTVSCIAECRTYRREEKGRETSVFDFNMNGILSDICVFYRF